MKKASKKELKKKGKPKPPKSFYLYNSPTNDKELIDKLRKYNVNDLRTFEIDSCFSITKIPENTANFTTLKVLRMTSCKIHSSFDMVCGLDALIELTLSDNVIQFIPESISNLTRLKMLFLDKNEIR